MDALSISSNVELNELDAYVASMKYIYLLVKGIMLKCIMEIIRNGVNNTYYESLAKLLPPFKLHIIYTEKTVFHGYADWDEYFAHSLYFKYKIRYV